MSRHQFPAARLLEAARARVHPGILSAAVGIGLALAPAPPLRAQGTAVAEGRVVRLAGGDSIPLSRFRILLHRVGKDRQGPLDSALTDADGRFRFAFSRDTSAIYILSGRYDGIAYFSRPVFLNPRAPDTNLVVAVSDTLSRAPVALEARHLVISAPAADGTRNVVELLLLRNPGILTRVARDTGSAVWSALIPDDAMGFSVGDGDFSADAVDRNRDSVLIMAPISPGEKQVSLQYVLPAGIAGIAIPFPAGTPTANVLLEERAARVTGGGLARSDSTLTIQGRQFTRWTGPMAAGSTLRIELPHPTRAPRWLLVALVGLVGAGLAAALVRAFARRPAAAVPPVLDQLAELDARYVGRESEVPAAEWREYLARREALKARLAETLAGTGGRP